MNNNLTDKDIEKIKQELSERKKRKPELIEEVKRTRAFGDLSENYEYKAAKQENNRNNSRIRYLEKMIATANIISDASAPDEVGLFDKVELYIEEDDETETVSVVSTVRVDPLNGLVSRESPLGRALLGKKVGDRISVTMENGFGYEAEIRSITKGDDDGSAPLLQY